MLTKNKKKNFIILGIEALALVISLIFFALPLKHYSYGADQFTSDKGTVIDALFDVQEPGFYLDNSMVTEGEVATVLSPKTDLRFGTYNITLKYLTNVNTNTYTCSSLYSTTPVLAGRVNAGLAVKETPDDGKVINLGSALNIDGYQVSFNYTGNGYMYVYGMEIAETTWWKYLVLLSVIGLSLLLNLVISVFSSDNADAKAAVFITAVLTFVSSIPLFSVYMFGGHDIYFHAGRIEAVAACFKNHQIPARVSDVWMNGFGYPASVFYNDLFLVPAALLRLLGCSIQGAYKFYVVFINLVTSVVSLFCFKKVLKSRAAAVIATGIFVLSPYRLICIYTRAAVGEYTGMLFYPVIFYGLYKIYAESEDDKKSLRDRIFRTLPLILGISGIISSHVLTCVMAAIFCVIYVLINWKKTFTARVLLDYLTAFVAIVLLNLWFIGPFIHLLSTGIGAAASTFNGRFRANGTFLWQIISLFPKTGISTSVDEALGTYQGEEITYAIGPALFSLLIYAGFAIYRPVKNKAEASVERKFGGHICVLAIITIIMTTIHFPWDFLKQLSGFTNMIITNIQFPWRFLGVVMLLLSLLSGFVYIMLKNEEGTIGKTALSYGLVMLVCVGISASFYLTSFCNSADWQLYTDPNSITPSVMSGEYLPTGTEKEGFTENYVAPSEGMSVSTWRRERGRIYATVENASGNEAALTVPFIYYLGYNAEDVLTGKRFATAASPEKLVTVTVPADFSGEICVFYKEPGIWHLFELISVAAVVLLICMGTIKKK